MSTINLLPKDYQKQRTQRRANRLCLILFVVVMAGISMAALVSEISTRRTLQVRTRVEKAYADAARLIAQMQQLQAKRSRLLGKACDTASLMERVPRSYLLAMITKARPKYASLRKVALETRQATIVSNPAARSKFAAVSQQRSAMQMQMPPTVFIDIMGLASTDVQVAKFIANLARHPLVGYVDLVFSKEKPFDDMTVREFKIKLELKPNVDVIDVKDEHADSGSAISMATPKRRRGL